MGLSWAIASLGVYLRDVGQLVGMFVTVLMFLSPIFFPISSLPPKLQILLFLNPLAPPIEMVRDVMYWGVLPGFEQWASTTLASLAVALIGFSWFQKTRKGFADVL